MVSDRQHRIVTGVLDAVDSHLPKEVAGDRVSIGQVFGIAAVRHAANLLGGELDLAITGRWSLTRLLGRSIAEAWLWANLLLLDPEDAVERLMAEDADHQRRLSVGREALWERLEQAREDGIDLRGTASTSLPAVERRGPNVRDLARQVRAVRERHGLGGGLAEVTYELTYRWESAHDVHLSFDLLVRYLPDLTTSGGTVLAQPGAEDIDDFRGPNALHQDTRLVVDAVGVYLVATGQPQVRTEIERALQRLAEAPSSS